LVGPNWPVWDNHATNGMAKAANNTIQRMHPLPLKEHRPYAHYG
jgi:hypothetical protein